MKTPDHEDPIRQTSVEILSDVLSASMRAVVSTDDGVRLLDEVCRLVVEIGGLTMARVGLLRPDGRDITVVAERGIAGAPLGDTGIALTADEPERSGPTWKAIRQGRPAVCNDLEADPDAEVWGASARRAGFRSMAAIPLLDESESVGVLSVYAAEPERFGDAVVERLQALARELAFGLRAIEARGKLAASEADARRRQHELETLFGAMSEAVVVLDHELRIIDLNPAFARLVGADRDALLGAAPPWPGWQSGDDDALALITRAIETGGARGRFLLPRVSGPHYVADMTIARLAEAGEPPQLVCTIHDVSDLEAARLDAVRTGDFLRAVTGAMVEGLYVVDGRGRLTYANEAAADMLRWSTDELVGVQAHETFHYQRTDGNPYPVEECSLQLSGRSGEPLQGLREAFVRRDGTMLDVVISAAPFATEGEDQGTVIVFTDAAQLVEKELHAELELAQLSWVGRVRDAITANRLVLYAQPIVDAHTLETVSHELLLRMISQDGALVPPATFLPAAERFGLMAQIDRWVAPRAVAVAARGIPIAFNLSAASFTDARVIGEFEAAIHRTGADASRIVVELTETALLQGEAAARAVLGRVRELGCRVALDDFGTGYGGLTYAKQFPVDILKIDVEFVRDAARSEESRSVVRAVVALAQDLGLDTVAEGIEDAATVELVRELGVGFLQGFHLGRPVPVDLLC